MCIFHKWTKWKQYTESGTVNRLLGSNEPQPYTERRQVRTCEKCGKEQDERVMPS